MENHVLEKWKRGERWEGESHLLLACKVHRYDGWQRWGSEGVGRGRVAEHALKQHSGFFERGFRDTDMRVLVRPKFIG